MEMDPTDLLTAPPTAGLVTELLHEVIDPELGVNIVDLGLVRDVSVSGAGDVAIVMTLTTPGCPLGGFIEDEIQDCLAQAARIGRVRVSLEWEPPWDPEQMTDMAREQLGWML
jgi:metal-sulfur cluster biosynthetic enzyme